MKTRRKYSNDEITVFWRPNECIHASVCFTKLYSVFNPRRHPWIVLDGADTKVVIDIVNECPTRALTFMWNDSEKNAAEISRKAEKDIDSVAKEFGYVPQENQPVEIKIMRNGPILVTGDFKIFDSDDCTLQPVKMVSLCRCGHTNNPSYCDGSHFKYGFRDEE